MEVWKNEHGALVDYTDVASAPCKDFFHIFVTPNEIIFRYWKIVPPTRINSQAPPVSICNTYVEFLCDDRVHSEIQNLAGDGVLQYLLRLANGKVDFLSRLPEAVLAKVLLDLNLEDIVHLGTTSKKFSKLCNSDYVWERIFRREVETPVTAELEVIAKKEGWKRLFFTNQYTAASGENAQGSTKK